MPIPTYENIMLPLLKVLGDQRERKLPEIIDQIADEFNLSEEERNELLPSGTQTRIYNRTSWAKTHLSKAGLIDYVSRGTMRISTKGQEVLNENPTEITNEFLRQFEGFRKFFYEKNTERKVKEESSTPEEIIEGHFERLKDGLINEILDTISNNSPIFFERLVIDVLLKLGYGGTEKEAKTTIRSNDEGIDGVIKEDMLGLEIIYIQAKRWNKDSSIGRPEIQKFAGALQGQKARKGIFITTSVFADTARDYVQNIDNKIILIDGQMLAELMIENNIGVFIKNSYSVKEIDSDYFIED